MQFEAGGQPVSGASGPITEPILAGFADRGQNPFYQYGAREGVPRLRDLLDRHGITMTPFMIRRRPPAPGGGRGDRAARA
ncbi:MAG: polysaccharide deacetylase [Actinomycetia bacterium]|nr:polysaccharide deacetylase [Actinomycetes bacterium]